MSELRGFLALKRSSTAMAAGSWAAITSVSPVWMVSSRSARGAPVEVRMTPPANMRTTGPVLITP